MSKIFLLITEGGNARLVKVEDLPGRTIAGYHLLEVLGRGGMSMVFLAESVENPQDRAAIKILMPPDVATTDEFVTFQARFLREAQAAQHLHHPHILPVLGYGEEGDLFYMIMPYMPGGTLAHRLASAQGPLPLDEIAGYLSQLAGAVDYANQKGMVHRDIKPSNVLLDEQGNVYLADFGIMRLFDSSHVDVDQSPTTLTTTGKMYGTPAYMAPERYKGEPAEPATDIYSLGVMLYQLVTRQVPFKADNPIALGMKHLNEAPIRPGLLRPDLPEPAEAAILKALAKQPSDRFASASMLAAAFDAGLKGKWVAGLLPLPALLATSLAETQLQPQVPVPPSVVPIPGSAHPPGQLVLGPAPVAPGGNAPPAFVPTSVNAPAMAGTQPRSRSTLQVLGLVALAAALLLFVGLLALAIYKVATPPAPGPATTPVPATTRSVPTRTGATPTPSLGVTPTPSPGNAPSPTAIPSPSPTPSPTPSATPTPSPSPTPSPTPSPSPVPTPTSGKTPGTGSFGTIRLGLL